MDGNSLFSNGYEWGAQPTAQKKIKENNHLQSETGVGLPVESAVRAIKNPSPRHSRPKKPTSLRSEAGAHENETPTEVKMVGPPGIEPGTVRL